MNVAKQIPIVLLAGVFTLFLANCAQAQESPRGKAGKGQSAATLQGLSKGKAVMSGRERYALLTDVRAVSQPHPEGQAVAVLEAQGVPSSEVVATKGNLIFYLPLVSKAGSARVRTHRTPAGRPVFSVVLNERTGGLGAVLGTIEVRLTQPGSARDLARDFGLDLVRDYPHLKAAFLKVAPGEDPFAKATALAGDPRVTSAKAEVLENPAIPH